MSETENQDVEQAAQPPTQQPTEPQSGEFGLGKVIEQAKQVITDPAGFYRVMPREGGYSEPLIFNLVMAAIAGAIFAVLSIIGLTGAGFGGVVAIIALPIIMLIGSFIAAAVLFVIWKLMGSSQSYQAAYRCVAYSYAILPVVTIIGVIPYVGTIVRTVWGVWLMVIASVEVHGRQQRTALIVFGILGVFSLMGGLSSEGAQRQMQGTVDHTSAEMEEHFRSLGLDENGEIDPEKAGRSIGAFLRGIQEEVEAGQQSAAGSSKSE